MTKEIALHCMKSASDLTRELCEECPIYGQIGSDHCFEDALQYVIGMLEKEPRKGHWLRMSDLSEQEDDRYKCSRCGNVIHHQSEMDLYTFDSWCGRCGSDNGRHVNCEVEK